MPAVFPSGDANHENEIGLDFLKHLLQDQKAIWTSPAHLHFVDADWLIPLGLAAGGMLATDTEYSKHLSNSPSRLKYSNDLSNYGVGAFAGVGAGLYFWGRITHDDHKSETGLLAGEAAMDSFGVTYALKYAFGRERPQQSNFRGNFFNGGDSFPSEHAAAAWSIASVIAHEYPGPLTSLFAYGAATAVSASRINAKQHFPADVLIGSAIGWYVGQHVYRAHHDSTIGGGEWETYAESHDDGSDRKTTKVGSPFVELESWIYPAIERLAALGYIRTDFLAMRPWTRLECAHLVEEAGERIRAEREDFPDVNRLYDELVREFRKDLDATAEGKERSAQVESIYTRMTGIDGQTLHDSYHFGQSIINDFGRPFGEGFNTVDGISGWATQGRFTVYVRGEYQHAPSSSTYSEAVRNEIANLDGIPTPSGTFPSADQFRLLDTYISADAANWNLSFGKQSLWWSPNSGSAFLFSNNAEPIYMFRASRIAPFTLPWIFHWLGPLKVDLFFGKLSGNQNPPRPLIHGEKFSFKPTPNLDFGFSRTVEMGGVGRPFTMGHLLRSYFSFSSSNNETPNTDPGKRTVGVDVSYRVPFVRNWLTIYTDSIADDDPPLGSPRRTGYDSGLYMPRIPRVHRLDFRFEGGYTDLPPFKTTQGHFIYYDSFYRDLYTNKGNIIGSWIGRQGLGYQAWSTYSFSAKNNVVFAYRNSKVGQNFIPGGGTQHDGSVTCNWWLHDEWNISSTVQYEKWNLPFLSATPQTNWTASLQVAFWPHSWSR